MLCDSAPHDVFISYAREDLPWVRENLYEPLLKCRTALGRPPRIFFDVGEHGIQIGQDFQTAIDRAIEKVHKFVPVYSCDYFRKEMCIYELELARSRDRNFNNQLLLPILIDEAGAEMVPFAFRRLNFLPLADPDWFKKLCFGLGLQPSKEDLTLAFIDQPGDVFANHTLPVVRVAAQSGGKPTRYDDEITLRVEDGQLLGSTTVKTQHGIATFDDLSIANMTGKTRLVARCPTLGETASGPFTVFSRASIGRMEAPSEGEHGPVTLPVSGEVVFFANGRSLAVLQPNRILAYSADARPLMAEPLRLRAPVRLIRRRGEYLVVADWQGTVHLLDDAGGHKEWHFGKTAGEFVVPADADIADGMIYVGFCSGSVFRVEPTGRTIPLISDAAGIQSLGVCGDRLFTCDFSGNLRVYRKGRLINTAAVEPVIWLFRDTPTCLVAVGEHKFYHVSLDGTRVIDFDLPLVDVASVYELSDRPIVMDFSGKAIRFDENLVVSTTVYIQSGAEPVSADDAGLYCIFRNSDDTRTLSVKERIVFSHAAGCLAVNPQGDLFALGNGSSIRLYPQPLFMEMLRREEIEVRQAESKTAGEAAG